MFINPNNLKASELKAIVALFKHGRPAAVSAGHIFTKSLVIKWNIINELSSLKIVTNENGNVSLTSVGVGIGKSFAGRKIFGRD
jgi:hypothetical protein